MKVTIVSQDKQEHSQEAVKVILPGLDGEFSVWDFHMPFLHGLDNGCLRIFSQTDKESNPGFKLVIKGGIAKMIGNNLTVLAAIGQDKA